MAVFNNGIPHGVKFSGNISFIYFGGQQQPNSTDWPNPK